MEHRITKLRKWIKLNARGGVVFVKSNDGLALSAAINQAKGYVTIKTVIGYGVAFITLDNPDAQNWQVFPTYNEARSYLLKAYSDRDIFPPMVLEEMQGETL